MKNKKILSTIILLSFMLILCVACSTGIKEIRVTNKNIVLYIGQTENVHIEIVGKYDGTADLVWTSSDSNVATVDSQGVITAKNVGNTLIRVEAHNGIFGVCYVEVKTDKGIIYGTIGYEKKDGYITNYYADNGAQVLLINPTIFKANYNYLTNTSVAAGNLSAAKDLSGCYYTGVDSSGKYQIEVPEGKYYMVVISKKFLPPPYAKPNGKRYWGPVYDLFSGDYKLIAQDITRLYGIEWAMPIVKAEQEIEYSHVFLSSNYELYGTN